MSGVAHTSSAPLEPLVVMLDQLLDPRVQAAKRQAV
jgi:hypothetical protein